VRSNPWKNKRCCYNFRTSYHYSLSVCRLARLIWISCRYTDRKLNAASRAEGYCSTKWAIGSLRLRLPFRFDRMKRERLNVGAPIPPVSPSDLKNVWEVSRRKMPICLQSRIGPLDLAFSRRMASRLHTGSSSWPTC
jgi:hypothetical protein